jgi:hypothetical protein
MPLNPKKNSLKSMAALSEFLGYVLFHLPFYTRENGNCIFKMEIHLSTKKQFLISNINIINTIILKSKKSNNKKTETFLIKRI